MSTSIDKIDSVLNCTGDVPVMGISEYQNWYQHYDLDIPELRMPVEEPERAITDCIDAHLNVGVNNLVWSCGRSVLQYHSNLEQSTRQSTELVKSILNKICPLRTALKYGREKGVSILGRLSMNRHYGPENPENCSRFVRENVKMLEKGRNGGVIKSRVCYALEAVQQERIDILLEIQRLGVDALVLDYCRQMPVLNYHEALVQPYLEKTGVDPRQFHSTHPEDYADWFQYRADILTGFMRRYRQEQQRQESESGRNCPLIVRIPDSAPWLMIAYGIDIERWCKENLIDGIMLSPFPRTLEDTRLYPEYHIETAQKYGKYAIGGIGSLNLMRSKGNGNTLENTGFFHAKPVYEKARRQYTAGCGAMSLYQSETLVRLKYLQSMIAELGNKKRVAERAQQLPDPDPETLLRQNSSVWSLGLDWHAAWCHPKLRRGETLSTQLSGVSAL
jgi:hypothetical protein